MDFNLLVSELQALSVEAKRRHTDVKDASDKALDVLKAGGVPRESLLSHADTLISPITLGCKTKTPKIIGIAITALQRLVALGGVPTASLPSALQTLNSVSSQGVDIQLKILQALLSILTYNRDAHDEVLGNALLLCFKLQDARVSVVSSTAAATLRQAVMLVFDRLSTDTAVGETATLGLSLGGDEPTEVHVTPSAMDAYCVLSDLCLLTARSGGGLLGWGGGDKEKPKLLKLSSLQRTFGLELIESILSGYEDAVKQRPELIHLLSHSLDPLLFKLLAEKPSFPIALRVCRLIFLLIRSFMEQLPKEVEAGLSTLIRLGMGDAEEEGGKKDAVQPWFRVLALEIIRGICGDGKLLQNLFAQFDQRGEPRLFAKLVSSLSRLMNEKPNLLGVSDQMHGLGVPSGDGNGPNSGYLDIGFGMVASAANAGVSTVSSMMGSQGGGLGPHSSLKLKLIEQHDKAEAPLIPETYIYLLALQSLDAVANGIHAMTTRAQAIPASLSGMAESAWPALLAALSFAMATNLSDTLFAEVLQALKEFTLACNTLSLQMPRNAFLNTLGKYAVPPPVVSAMQTYLEGGAGRKDSVLSPEGLGIGAALGVGATTTPPSLSERNLACLKSTIATARLLSSDLDTAWHDVLEVLQNATFMLGAKRPSVARRATAASPKIASRTLEARQSIDEPRSEVFEGIDSEEIAVAINVLFDSSTQMDDRAFTTFLTALCRLSTEMIGVDALRPPLRNSGESERPGPGSVPSTPRTPSFPMSPSPDSRRRTSGFTISSSAKSTEKSFSLVKLRTVGLLNVHRLVSKDPEVGWGILTQHLLGIARHGSAPSTIRLQASETLGEFLLSSMRSAKDANIQHQVFEVLGGQVAVQPVSTLISTDYDVRSAGYQTLNQILESSGHSLEVGWTTIFSMLNDVCHKEVKADTDTAPSSISAGRPSAYHKGDANLVRIAFPSLNLICTDFLSSLGPDAMRQCISCLGYFGRQKEDVNITLSAIGLMWNVSDAVQADSKDLWLELLLQLLELGRDTRSEVRGSSMQTLFRCIELYGSSLSADLWDQIWWKVVHPLIDASKGDESQVLALNSVGAIFGTFFDKLRRLPTFEKVYTTLLAQTREGFESDDSKVHLASLKSLERIVQAAASGPATTAILERVWETFIHMGNAVRSKEGYTQESLIALVRIASLLHDHLNLEASAQAQSSDIIGPVLTYTHSPEYRPDIDVMSPLQKAIFDLLSSSTKIKPTLLLSDLAICASLAYRADTIETSQKLGNGKYTFVGLSKAVMPLLVQIVERHIRDQDLLLSGTLDKVLAAYETPIRLKYSCPPSSRFNDDPPLWKTAMSGVNGVLRVVLPSLETKTSDTTQAQDIWTRIVAILRAILLAENTLQTSSDEQFVLSTLKDWKTTFIPQLVRSGSDKDSLVGEFARILQTGSKVFHYDVEPGFGGTTATAIAESSEETAYWSFDMLVAVVSSPGFGITSETESKERGRDPGIASLVLPALLERFDETLCRFVQDVRLRGRVPLERVRQEEVLFVLRQLATLTVPPSKLDLAAASPRAHLFRFYPLLLDISFLEHVVPTMWVLPAEYARLFPSSTSGQAHSLVNGDVEAASDVDVDLDAGDGDDLIEVSARDLARWCLVIIGKELGLGQG